jgi:hypothetical protein
MGMSERFVADRWMGFRVRVTASRPYSFSTGGRFGLPY